MMGTKALKTAMNLWAISDQAQKQKLMRKFLESHGELTSKNDFIGFLVAECGIEKLAMSAGSDSSGCDGQGADRATKTI